MRLIDADLIPTEISLDPKENKVFHDTIDEQPTVPAVPINIERCDFIAVYLQFYIQKYGPVTEEDEKRLIKILEALYGKQYNDE